MRMALQNSRPSDTGTPSVRLFSFLGQMSDWNPGDVIRSRWLSVLVEKDRKFDCQVTINVFTSNSSIMPDGLAVSAWEALVLGKLGREATTA
jgi:hypothetical protein